jgi:hypothetical protein
MITSKIKFTVLIILILLTLLFVYSSCKKECIQCKTQFRTYQMYKGTDTIIVEAIGQNILITNKLDSLRGLSYILIDKLSDSLYYEDFCGTKELKYLKTIRDAKTYCYPI